MLVALAVALAAGAITAIKIHQIGNTSDFAVWWLAGRAVLDGVSPYTAVHAGVRPYVDSGFLYPMPTAVVASVFAVGGEQVGAILFSAVGAGLLTFALTRHDYHRLPILMSYPMLVSLTSVQWAPWIAAAAVLPALQGLTVCKPTIGAAAFLARPTWLGVIHGMALVVLSVAIAPHWPLEWWRALQTAVPGSKVMPVAVLGGPLLVLAALRWREWEARLLLALALVPQTVLFYDQLLVLLVVKTRKEALIAGLWSYAVPVGGYWLMRDHMPTTDAGTFQLLARLIVWGYYLPALGLVLWRRNEPAHA